MKKVIVRLGNGLGNQLFTYAAAYTFAKNKNAKLFVDDKSGFYKRYKYELHNFKISAPVVENKYKFVGLLGRSKRKLLIRISKFNKDSKFLIEHRDNDKFTSYQPKNLDVNFKKNLYFEGYFQSEKYYEKEAENIHEEFSFKNNVVNQENKFLNDIKKNNSVSIHLRQDKFLSDEKHKNIDELNKHFLENNVSSIKKGVDYFDKKIENPKYFIWSNNFLGIESIFNRNKFTFVDSNLDKDPAYDLYLMSLCKHFILSPSTLHYWAAFLSKSKNKICISPINIKNQNGYYGFSNNKNIKPVWWREI